MEKTVSLRVLFPCQCRRQKILHQAESFIINDYTQCFHGTEMYNKAVTEASKNWWWKWILFQCFVGSLSLCSWPWLRITVMWGTCTYFPGEIVLGPFQSTYFGYICAELISFFPLKKFETFCEKIHFCSSF